MAESWFGKIGGGIKDALWEDDGKKPAAAPAQQPQPQQVRAGGPTPTYAPIPPQVPQLNQGMVDAIRAATFKRNTALTALLSAAEALKDIVPDLVMRLKAAHKTAAAGRNPKEIADAVTIHLNDIDGEQMRFKQALEQKSKAEIGGVKTQADTLEQTVARKQEEIANLRERANRLEQEIQSDANQVHALRQEVAQREQDFATSAAEFEAAVQSVRSELEGHRNVIMSTLS